MKRKEVKPSLPRPMSNNDSHWKLKTGVNEHTKQVKITVHIRVPLTQIMLTVYISPKHILILNMTVSDLTTNKSSKESGFNIRT